MVNGRASIALILFSVAVSSAAAQSATACRESAVGGQAQGFWTDTSTGLTWAGKDSGKDLSYKGALKYCRELRLAGYADWRLANMAELQGIYDGAVASPGLAGPHDRTAVTWHVKGNLFLTGLQWANNNGTGPTSGYEDYFDFNSGKPDKEPSGFPYSSQCFRALCVRGSHK